MRLRVPVLVVALLAGCGSAPPVASPYGTSLFVTTRWNSQASRVSVLYLVGLVDGRDAFPASFRPEQIPTEPLSGPQTVRVLLADDLVGRPVELQVYGYDRDGALQVTGVATSPPVEQGAEVSVTVLLDQPFDAGPVDGPLEDAGAGADAGTAVDAGAPPDAGSQRDGGAADAGAGDGGALDAGPADAGVLDGGAGSVDAGPADAGVRPDAGTGAVDAGVPSCGCSLSCCAANTTTCAAPTPLKVTPTTSVPLAVCGATGATCTQTCDPMTAVTCVNGQCTCGLNVCRPGQRCAVVNNVPTCLCDVTSNCPGCCNGTECVLPAARTNQLCGAGSQKCANCGGSQQCNQYGVCQDTSVIGNLCPAGTCRSAGGCENAGFPVCSSAAPVATLCVACDPLRSERCGLGGSCMCGTSTRCGPTQYCDRTGAAPVCKALPL